MGFPQEEVKKALESQKYNEVTGVYLLLGRKAAEVRVLTATPVCLLQAVQPAHCAAVAPSQVEGGASLSSTNLVLRSRPSSDLNGPGPSPAHPRTTSATQKQRRFSDHGDTLNSPPLVPPAPSRVLRSE